MTERSFFVKPVPVEPRGRPEPPPPPRRRYRHLWPGLLLLTSLGLLLAVVLVWGQHLLSPAPTGGLRRLLYAPAQSREAPAAPRGVAGPPAEQAALDPPGTPPADSSARAPAAVAPALVPEEPRPESEAERPLPPAAKPKARYALEIGAFLVSEDADKVEARLHHAGFSTVRFRQHAGASLFGVFIDPLPSLEEAAALVERLRRIGLGEAVIHGGPRGLSVRVGEPAPLGVAVRLAGRARGAGHEVRISEQAGRATHITLRHGSFASREEAQAVSGQVAELGVPNDVVRVR